MNPVLVSGEKFKCVNCDEKYPLSHYVDRQQYEIHSHYTQIFNIYNTNIKHILCGNCFSKYGSHYVNGKHEVNTPFTLTETKFTPLLSWQKQNETINAENVIIYVQGYVLDRNYTLTSEQFLFFGLNELKSWIQYYHCTNPTHKCHTRYCINNNYKAYVSDFSTGVHAQHIKDLHPTQRLHHYILEDDGDKPKETMGVITLLEEYLETKYWMPNNLVEFITSHQKSRLRQIKTEKQELQDQIQKLVSISGKLNVEEYKITAELAKIE